MNKYTIALIPSLPLRVFHNPTVNISAGHLYPETPQKVSDISYIAIK
jgi:hypothetical protein